MTPLPTGTAVVPAVLDQNVFRPLSGRPLGIAFKPVQGGRVTVRIFNVAGELLRTPFDAEATAGLWYQAQWSGDNDSGQWAGSGLYVVSVRGGGIASLRKVVLIK